jgi:hypothetical protein
MNYADKAILLLSALMCRGDALLITRPSNPVLIAMPNRHQITDRLESLRGEIALLAATALVIGTLFASFYWF